MSWRSDLACPHLARRICGSRTTRAGSQSGSTLASPMNAPLGKAVSQAEQVLLFPFASGAATWWRTVGPKVAGMPNLTVVQIPHAPVQQLAQTVDRRVSAQVMVVEGQVTMTVGGVDATFTPSPMG